MRTLLVSDIHSNLVALRAVLEDAQQRGGWDRIWNMGDIVGYGPEPSACLKRLLDEGAVSVAGNHDWASVGKVPLTDFNYVAAEANRWTSAQLKAEHRSYLESLPLTLRFDDFTLVHGSPRDPIWEYLTERADALANFALLTSAHAAIGHSHVALAFRLDPQTGECRRMTLKPGEAHVLGEGRWIINPGSVGQPRDGDARAAYALLEDDALTAHRVAYDIQATQTLMEALGLPSALAARLSFGR
ncbi:MAG: metallophosphoesterase family protein [Chloroflexi bacterium]|nr:metallophosphoesterase family protein [Chloroflexota bacterium]